MNLRLKEEFHNYGTITDESKFDNINCSFTSQNEK